MPHRTVSLTLSFLPLLRSRALILPSRPQYSFSLTTFSPSGKLVQIEHALNAVNQGSTALGIKAKDGVVIATEKKLPSTLVDGESVKKIVQITPEVSQHRPIVEKRERESVRV